MKKTFCLFLLVFAFYGSYAQKKITAAVLGQFSFAATNLATNDAGVGATVAVNFFADKRLQLRTEASVDHFIGSKELLRDANGNSLPSNPTITSIKAGPEFFLTKSLSVAGLYGYASYSLFDMNVKEDAVKFLLSQRWGAQKKWIAGMSFSSVLRKYNVRFFGLHLGYRVI
jgi:hypothetical protein